ncbi:hypothetical protein SOASR030_27940 [Leminorella grimontii]|uniref:Fimbrial protein n=1 Tax=Leminorella grimontii TaxID=82981 RepID=A0AAV5N7I2_9GAMM|nr:hypothetical protein [Leminorella grimontii]GKX56682.1 hypothetical protein SOASR030_27940 [Leminorella grimontii]VFS61972.1 Uncharacterised protein [Leminorella grimontii]
MLNSSKRRQRRINGLRPLLGMGLLLCAGGVNATTLNFSPIWSSSSQIAANCSFSYPTLLRSDIKKSGSTYTGQVTGRVNMFVTYH